MTDMLALAKRLYEKIKWQRTPQDVAREDQLDLIAEGIRELYTMTGRGFTFQEDWFIMEGEAYSKFAQDLPADEKDYVILAAAILFYTRTQDDVTTLVSYTTDAMSVTHGDKPYANLEQRITNLKSEKNKVWYKMTRYHHL